MAAQAEPKDWTKSFDIDVVGMQFIPWPIDRIFDQYQKGSRTATPLAIAYTDPTDLMKVIFHCPDAWYHADAENDGPIFFSSLGLTDKNLDIRDSPI